jgi:hypothetical protein
MVIGTHEDIIHKLGDSSLLWVKIWVIYYYWETIVGK